MIRQRSPRCVLDEAAPGQARHRVAGVGAGAEAVALGEGGAAEALAGVIGEQVERFALGGFGLLAVGEGFFDHGEVGLLVVDQLLEGILDVIDRRAGGARLAAMSPMPAAGCAWGGSR